MKHKPNPTEDLRAGRAHPPCRTPVAEDLRAGINTMYSDAVGQIMMGHNASHISHEFYKLIKSVGETYSKQEENEIMAKEARNLKEKLKGSAALPRNRLKEFVVRCIYLEMLGHDAQFGHMKAVELAASSKVRSQCVFIVNAYS
eukprot:scaffold7341_cov229-Pinguiococcus_pyrenoidosus.AAC.4